MYINACMQVQVFVRAYYFLVKKYVHVHERKTYAYASVCCHWAVGAARQVTIASKPVPNPISGRMQLPSQKLWQTQPSTYIHKRTHTYIRTHTYTSIHVHTHICIYIYTYMHIYTRTYTHIHHIYAYMHMYTHTYTYQHIHTHTHRYIYIYR